MHQMQLFSLDESMLHNENVETADELFFYFLQECKQLNIIPEPLFWANDLCTPREIIDYANELGINYTLMIHGTIEPRNLLFKGYLCSVNCLMHFINDNDCILMKLRFPDSS